jgi:hypothetical protein
MTRQTEPGAFLAAYQEHVQSMGARHYSGAWLDLLLTVYRVAVLPNNARIDGPSYGLW